MSSLYHLSGTYRVHLTANHWAEAYDDLKHRTEARTPRKTGAATRRRQQPAPRSDKSPTRH